MSRGIGDDPSQTMRPYPLAHLAVLGLALIGIACAGSGSTTPGHAPARARAVDPVRVLASGRMTTRGAAVVFAVPDPEAWAALVVALRDEALVDLDQAIADPVALGWDPEREVLLFVEFPDKSGSELRSRVDGFVREGPVGRVLGRLEWDPEGSMTDDLNRTWMLVAVTREAMAGVERLTLEVELPALD